MTSMASALIEGQRLPESVALPMKASSISVLAILAKMVVGVQDTLVYLTQCIRRSHFELRTRYEADSKSTRYAIFHMGSPDLAERSLARDPKVILIFRTD